MGSVPPELALSGLIGVGVCAAAIRRVNGTTLVAPVGWAAISWMSLVVGELIAYHASASTAPIVRYTAAVSTFCAPMALLGAKRPQDRGWQFIVASLWLVLCVPAIQLVILTPSGTLELHLAWRILLGTLILVGVTNHLPTRFGWAALLYGIGQWQLVDVGFLPSVTQGREVPWLPLGCLLTSAMGPWLQATLWPRRSLGWNRVWSDFRDAFGCVWALRVAERMNQAASQTELPIRFHWQGVAKLESSPTTQDDSTIAESGHSPTQIAAPFDPQELGELEVTMRQLLRRFVSAEWIDARMHRDGEGCLDPSAENEKAS